MARKKNPCVFLDVSIGDDHAGKMVFELFADVVPKTAENFRALCTGEKGVGKTTLSPLYCRGTRFHSIMKGLMVQGGDFSKNNGTGGESIYGGTFADENFVLRHDDRGLLSMANTGPNTNGSQFFITFKPAPHLDRKNTVFGKLILGDDVLRKIERVDVDGSSPVVRVKIVDCGMHMESKDHRSMASENDKVKADDSNLMSRKRSSKRRDNSNSPRRGPIKPSVSLKRSVSQSPVHQSHDGTPIHPVQSSMSTSPTRRSISVGPCGRSPSRSSSRSASRSPHAPLSRSRSSNPSNDRKRSSNGRSGRHLSWRSHSTSPEVSPVPPVSRRRSISPIRSVSRSPVRRSRRSRSRSPRGVFRRSLKSSHVRSRRSSVHSPTLHHRSRRSISRGGSPPSSRRARSPSSDHGRSLSRIGSSDRSPKRIRKGRGFTRRYSFVRKYRSPTPDRLSVRSYNYGGRDNRDRYASYQSTRYHRHY